jgi:hypothetical protein
MSDFPTNNEQLDEQLTAYLDGELPPAEARRVEDMLAADDRARKRLNQLASSWDLLDQLPRSAVDEKFARTTVEMVAVSAEKELAESQAAGPSQRHTRWLAAAVIALLAAGVGFAAVSVATPNNNDALLDDLPVVVNLNQYRPVGSIDVLRELSKTKQFAADTRPRFGGQFPDRNDGKKDNRGERRGELRLEPEKLIVKVPATLEERREWVAKQSAEEKLELRRSFERFSALSLTERDALRTLDRELNTDQDREELVKIIRRFNAYLKSPDVSPADRAALEDLPPKEKVAWIEQHRRNRESGAFFLFQDYAKRHEKDLLDQLPAATKTTLQTIKKENPPPRGSWIYYNRLMQEAWRNPDVTFPAGEADLRPIVDHIKRIAPPDSPLRQQLEGKTDAQIVEALRDAVLSGAFAREMPRFGGFGQGRRRFDPKQFEASLTEEQKEKLKGLTGEEKVRKLEEMWWQTRGGDRNRFRGEFPRGGFGEGPQGGELRPDGGPGPGPDAPFRGGQRRDGERREGDPRGPDGIPRGDRERRGPPGRPPEFRPGEQSDEPFSPPPDDERRSNRPPPND